MKLDLYTMNKLSYSVILHINDQRVVALQVHIAQPCYRFTEDIEDEYAVSGICVSTC